MHFYTNERTVLCIDGEHLHNAARTLGFTVDYKRLIGLFRSKACLVRAYYYFVDSEEPTQPSLRPLAQWLECNGFTIIAKRGKFLTETAGRRTIKGSVDIDIAVQALQLADYIDHVVLFSGNSDFCYLLRALQQSGKRVSVVSTVKAETPIAAREIQRVADQFVDLADIRVMIAVDVQPPARPKLP